MPSLTRYAPLADRGQRSIDVRLQMKDGHWHRAPRIPKESNVANAGVAHRTGLPSLAAWLLRPKQQWNLEKLPGSRLDLTQECRRPNLSGAASEGGPALVRIRGRAATRRRGAFGGTSDERNRLTAKLRIAHALL
jgi:hypothetical protein